MYAIKRPLKKEQLLYQEGPHSQLMRTVLLGHRMEEMRLIMRMICVFATHDNFPM